MRKLRGFTLIELVIVVAIIAIIASIAYPAYQRYAFRTRRADGKDFAIIVAAAEERYFTSFGTYTANLTTLGLGNTSPHGYYSLGIAGGALDAQTCAAAAGNITTTYTITTTPTGLQSTDACGALRYDSLGSRCPSVSDTTANSNGTCWP